MHIVEFKPSKLQAKIDLIIRNKVQSQPQKEKADDLNSIKAKINHPGANGWFIFWKRGNKSLRKFEMDDLFPGFTISVHVSQ